MSPFPRWCSILRITLLASLGLILAVAAFVQIQQRILRWRAEHLLADIRGLELGKSIWLDAQRIMTRWGAWGSYQGSCTEVRCSYQINLLDILGKLDSTTLFDHVWTMRLYHLVGGRIGFAVARIDVIDGFVWGKSYALDVDATDASGREYVLSASADTVWRTEQFHDNGSSLHPEYRIGHPGACTGCKYESAQFTPFADPEVIKGLMEFNLDCLTRRKDCEDQMDIMPSIERRVIVEKQTTNGPRNSDESKNNLCSQYPEFLGRDQANVAVAQVEYAHPHETDTTSLDIGFRLEEPLKHATFWKLDTIRKVTLPAYMVDELAKSARSFRPGEKFILGFHSPYEVESPDWLDVYPCAPLPLTAQNLAAVRRGISRDIFPETREFWP